MRPRNSLPALAASLLILVSASATAQTKQQLGAEIDALAAQIRVLKQDRANPGVQAQLDSALASYLSLVDQISYDPLNLRPGRPVSASFVAPAAPPGGTSQTTSFANNTPVAIVDLTTISSTISVTGVDTYLHDIDLTAAITHTWSADLIITLTSPAGTTVTISSANGGSNDDVFNGTIFDDSASVITTDATYANGVPQAALVPEGAMGAFIGEDPNGTWTIEIEDTALADTGTLNSWSLDVTTLTLPPIATIASFSNTTPVAIVDLTTVSSTIAVSGTDTYLCDVNLDVAITHTWTADLIVTLTSPGGTTTTISSANGGSNDDVFNGTTFDDDATETVTDTTYANGVPSPLLVPEGAMGAFIGEDPTGTWTIEIEDTALADSGTLNSWSLDVTSCVGAAPAPNPLEVPALDRTSLTLLLLALAAAGLAVIKSRQG